MIRTKAAPMKKYRLEVDPRILELLGPTRAQNMAHLGTLVAIRKA